MNGALHDDKMEQARVPSQPVPSNVIQNGQDDAPRPGGRRLSRNEAAMGFKLDPREIGWAPLRDDRRRPRPRPVRACGRDVPQARLVGRAPVAANARSWTPVLTCRERFAELSL